MIPLAEIRSYRRDPLGFFVRRAREIDHPVVRCPLPGDAYLLLDPDDIRHVLVGNDSNYVKSRRIAGARAEYPNPHTVLTSAGAEHRRRRRAMQPILRSSFRARAASRARVNAERIAASWRPGDEVDVGGAMAEITQRTVLEALLGAPSEQQLMRLTAAARARRTAFDRHFISVFPLLEFVPFRYNRERLRATRLLRATFDAEIAQRRSTGERPDDVLSLLMDAEFDDGSRPSDREVRDELLTLSLIGYDSLGESLVWTLYLLARHPDAGAGVAAEPTGAYATAAVREALRLFPPTWIFVRIARAPDLLPSGARVPARAKVYLCPFVIHRSASHWPDPERFDPERFANGRQADRPRYAYFPFGGGPHTCIGETAALDQILVVLEAILRRHRLSLPPGSKVIPEGGLTLRPRGGLVLRAEPRSG